MWKMMLNIDGEKFHLPFILLQCTSVLQKRPYRYNNVKVFLKMKDLRCFQSVRLFNFGVFKLNGPLSQLGK